ncbi:hypothetical protein [Leuconostoc mesenteroides]|uniref:hypothetical protein n=1 Tax=Leuconostoc mesenteroides TaxID=1245 RepID=UPI00248D1CD7|nr:hypothetical protein [Leuconostoc mesenteroides]
MEKNWYYEYEPTSFQYIRAVFSETQPDNTTSVAPEGTVGTPTFDKVSNQWVGESVQEWQEKNKNNAPTDELADLKKSFANYQATIAKTTSSLMLQIANQSKEIESLKNDGGNSNV